MITGLLQNKVRRVRNIEVVIEKELSAMEVKALKVLGFEKVTVLRGQTLIKTTADKLPIEGYEYYLRREITAEEGGAVTSSGDAFVYADMLGGRLKDFQLVTSGQDKYAYGYVTVPLSLKLIRVDAAGPRLGRKDITISIETVDQKTFEIKNEVIWEVEELDLVELIPERMEMYSTAILAAARKAGDYHCHQTYFY